MVKKILYAAIFYLLYFAIEVGKERVANIPNHFSTDAYLPHRSRISSLFLLLSLVLKGSFTNYVDKFLTFFDHLPPPSTFFTI